MKYSMTGLIKERAKLRYDLDLTSHDCESIIDKYFFNLIKDGQPWIKGIDCAINDYLG